MDKVVVTRSEVERAETRPAGGGLAEARLGRAMPVWAKVGLAVLAPVLPALCGAALAVKVWGRNKDARTRLEWEGYVNAVLIASGLATSAAMVLALSLRWEGVKTAGVTELGGVEIRSALPALPAEKMTGEEAAARLKPLVAVVEPVWPVWRAWQGGGMGAGTLLYSELKGHLYVTALHVMQAGSATAERAAVTLQDGRRGGARLVGIRTKGDLALLWAERAGGHEGFRQPLAPGVVEGQSVYVFGHPEGLKFSIATGMVSRLDGEAGLQLSAAVSPGNSGGPAFDVAGRLAGIVVSKIDRARSPNAEGLAFATSAAALESESGWEFRADGRGIFKRFLESGGRPGKE